MPYDLEPELPHWQLQPRTVTEEVLQNVRFYLATQKGTCPLQRDFGIDWAVLDHPIQLAEGLLAADIAQGLERYEPRARLLGVSIVPGDFMGGHVVPRVRIEVVNA